MSDKYEPKVGDRVRVVLEGEVTWVGANYFGIGSRLNSNYIDQDQAHVASVERLPDPLPTTPGSVIKSKGMPEVFGFLTTGGWRYSESGALFNPDPPSDGHWSVEHDAGQVQP